MKAKDSDHGIEKWLKAAGIQYHSFIELGNLFLAFEDWQTRYGELLQNSGPLLAQRLLEIREPYCLLCAERRVADCHRRYIADLVTQLTGDKFVHLD